MKTRMSFAVAGLTFATVLTSSIVVAKDTKPASAGLPSADSILRQMSDKLAAAKQFSFRATRKITSTLAAERGLQADAKIEVKVRRPNAVVATSTSEDAVRSVYFDGKNFSMLDAKEKVYATVPMQASLDALPARLATQYGFVPPLADFIVSNPYKDMRFRAEKISYVGKEACPGSDQGECNRIALTGKFADSEMWIAVADQLPRKVTATLKDGTTSNGVTIEFSDWNLAASVGDQDVTFNPPEGAMKVPMITTAEVEAANNKKK